MGDEHGFQGVGGTQTPTLVFATLFISNIYP